MFNPQLDLFSPGTYQDEIQGYEYQTVRAEPKSGPVIFRLENNKEYIDLSKAVLCIKAKIVTGEGAPLPDKVGNSDETQVAFVNNAMHSMFSDIIVKLNDYRIEGGRPHYPYKAYISTAFRMHEERLKNQVFAQGWAKDNHAKMKDVTNAGYLARIAWTDKSQVKEFYGMLERAKDSFALMCKNSTLKPKVEIEQALLHIKTIKLHPEIMNHHLQILGKDQPAIYPLNRIEMSYVTMKVGDKDLLLEHMFHGRVPKYLVMAMAAKTAFHGDYTKNPYNFKNYSVCSLSLKKDRELFPYEEFKPDFKNKSCLREYLSLYESNGILGHDETLPISYEEFLNGYTHFQWNLSKNGRGVNSQPDERGNVVLKMEFAEPLPEAVTLIFYAVFDGTVYLFGSGVVQTDYDS